MQHWSIELDATGRSIIKHDAAPRFTAKWTTGATDLSAVEGLFWQDEGSGDGDDTITIYDFQWIDSQPDQSAFDGLMNQTALVVDDWIAKRF